MPEAEVDPRDGSAVEELAADSVSRSRFMKMVGGGGAVAFSMFLAACGDNGDNGQEGVQTETQAKAGTKGDVAIVNYALTLEYLEADFYAKVIDSGLFKGKEGDLVKLIGQNEQEHVEALTATIKQLGATPAKKPKTTFDSVINGGRKKVLETAAIVENLGAAAYLGQAGRIKSKDILAAALAIHTVEGRHAAVLNRIVGKSFVPDGAFAKPASMSEVLPQIKPFIAS